MRRELARFLRARREELRPADVGLPPGGRRRTPGLRREEVASLAHMSVDYYARLEQARGPRPSPRILDALSLALRLTPAERSHLFRLAGANPTPPEVPARRARPHLVDLLRRVPDTAAIVTDATCNVIAWNPLANAVLGGDLDVEPNLARRRFLGVGRVRESTSGGSSGGSCGDLCGDSSEEEYGRIAVARLRRAAIRYPRDEGLARLLAELRAGSAEFAHLWDTNPVYAPGHRRKTIVHPDAGPLRVNCDVLAVPEDDQEVVFVTADPGTRAARALRHLRLASAAPEGR